MALRCRQPIQPRGLRIVLRHAHAHEVEAAEGVLRTGETLRCREPIQPRGLSSIICDAVARLVAAAELEQRVGNTPICSPAHLAARGNLHENAWSQLAEHGAQLHDNDDDGEACAGMARSALLDLSRAATTRLPSIVSRWHGRVQLGADCLRHVVSTYTIHRPRSARAAVASLARTLKYCASTNGGWREVTTVSLYLVRAWSTCEPYRAGTWAGS
jgi:hypothetical protein